MIVYLPSEIQPNNFDCAICRVKLTSARTTTGLPDANGRQAFACISHLFEVERLINGWADFTAQERMKHLQQGKEPVDLLYGGVANA
jgi:hypothetical protein